MSEKQNPTPEQRPESPFRWNTKVMQMVGVLMVALALPVSIAILGIRDLQKNSRPAPEVEGLRGSLENVVNSQWQPPVLEGAIRTALREVPSGEACLKIGEDVQKIARDAGGTVLTPERIESGGTRWLVQVPADQKTEFESGLAARGFSLPSGGMSDDPVFYAVEIRIAP